MGSLVNTTIFVDDYEDEDKTVNVTIYDDREDLTQKIVDKCYKVNGIFETQVKALEVEFYDDHLSYDEYLQMIPMRNLIDELLFARVIMLD